MSAPSKINFDPDVSDRMKAIGAQIAHSIRHDAADTERERNGFRRLDGVDLAYFLARQLEVIKAKVYDVKYPALKAKSFFPVSAEDPGAETITYRMLDAFGMAKIIANYAKDFPRVDVFSTEHTVKVKSVGSSYDYSIQDLRRSSLAGRDLESDRAKAARRMIETTIDDIVAIGIPSAGTFGVLNHPNIGATAAVGAWGAATPDAIIADVNNAVQAIITATKSVYAPDTLLLPPSAFTKLSSTPRSATSDTTILQWIMKNSPYIRNIDQWVRLENTGPGVTRQALLYVRDEETGEIEIPLDFEQLEPYREGATWVVDCHARVAGFVCRQPLAYRYLTSI